MSQIPMDATPKVIILEITELATGNVIARNIVGKCPLLSEVPANVNELVLQNPPIDIKTTTASMLAFEKLGNSMPNLPAFDYASMTPDANGVVAKTMMATDTTPFTVALNKAVGGSSVVDSIILARQGVKEAQAGVTQIRQAVQNYPMMPELLKTGLSTGANMIESSMTGIKTALNMVPSTNIPNPAATTELLKAYVILLNEIPKIQAHFQTLTAYGAVMPADMFSGVPSSITLPGASGATNTVNKDTTAAQIAEFVRAIPVQQ
jgi:hypothetical protein